MSKQNTTGSEKKSVKTTARTAARKIPTKVKNNPLAISYTTSDESMHQRMIAEAAYYRAERRGFTPGHELEDWLVAEMEITNRPPNNAYLAREVAELSK